MFILVIWLAYIAGSAPPVVVTEFRTVEDCEAAGKVWDRVNATYAAVHHVCLPRP